MDEQYGGRNGRSAIDVVMLMELTLGIFHLQRSNGAITDCDATACYDCIIALLVALAYSKAAFGVSEEFNKHSPDTPLHGLGQGSTDGPTRWNFLSDKIIKAHNKRAKGSTLTDPGKWLSVKRSADKFVNDFSLINNAKAFDASADKIMSYVQNDIQSWGMFLKISGGKLELTKMKYLMLIWAIKPNGTPTLRKEETLPVNIVKLTDQEGNKESIERISETKGQKKLGVRKAGNLQEKTELAHLLKKTQNVTLVHYCSVSSQTP
eukprot:scaffold124289_cov63-Attheya_sp.AAC.2